MPDASVLPLFILASATLVAIPGPAVVYIVTRGMAQGRRAAVSSALGIECGAIVHVIAAAAGISAIVASSATAFSVVKYAGAAYLVWLGIQRLRSKSDIALGDLEPESHWHLFRQGIVVNVLNPKVAVFFLAFLPQFVETDSAVAPQVLVLGTVFIVVAAAIDIAWGLAAGSVGERLRRSVRVRQWLDRVSGVTFIGLGGIAALARR